MFAASPRARGASRGGAIRQAASDNTSRLVMVVTVAIDGTRPQENRGMQARESRDLHSDGYVLCSYLGQFHQMVMPRRDVIGFDGRFANLGVRVPWTSWKCRAGPGAINAR